MWHAVATAVVVWRCIFCLLSREQPRAPSVPTAHFNCQPGLQSAPTAGKLMGQLHDRNCRRAFAPAEAFQADALPAERFQSEVQVRAAGNGCLRHGAAGQCCGSGPCVHVG